MAENNLLVLITGISGNGKSSSLKDIPNQERWLYQNCESGKPLPFANKFKEVKILDPDAVATYTRKALESDKFDGTILDSATFWMDMVESKYTIGVADSRAGWVTYKETFINFMQKTVATATKPVVILAHVRSDYDEKSMSYKTKVPIKGSLKNNGVESYFSIVIATKIMQLNDLEPYLDNGLLTVTEDEKILGYKHVFQVRHTKDSLDEVIKTPIGLFSIKETFMDNNVALLMDKLRKYYNV